MYAKRRREHRLVQHFTIRINGKSSMERKEHKEVQLKVSRGLTLPRITSFHSKTYHPRTSMANQILNWQGNRILILVFLRRTSQDLKQRNKSLHLVLRVMIKISKLIRIRKRRLSWVRLLRGPGQIILQIKQKQILVLVQVRINLPWQQKTQNWAQRYPVMGLKGIEKVWFLLILNGQIGHLLFRKKIN